MKKQRTITYKTIKSMTDQEIIERCVTMVHLMDDMNVKEQLMAATNLLRSVAVCAVQEHTQHKEELIAALGVAFQHIVQNVKEAKEE